MILVAGGTGRLGTLVVSRLQTRGESIRVLTRDASRGEAARRKAGVEFVVGDVRDRARVDAAMDGVTTVVSCVQGFAGPGHVSPESVDRAGNFNLIDAAAEVDAAVVLMSIVGAAPDNPMELFRAKHAAEQHLATSGVDWTIVRATAFVELWSELLAKAPVFGRGDNPINFVSVHDVAALVERAVVDTNLRGQIVEIGGPQNLTFNELAQMTGEVRGKPKRIRHVPRPLLRAMAPLTRMARAAVAMDTIDMTFDAGPARESYSDLPVTNVNDALTRAG